MTTPAMTTRGRPPLWRTATDITFFLGLIAVWLVAAGWAASTVAHFVFGVSLSVAQGALAATLVSFSTALAVGQ